MDKIPDLTQALVFLIMEHGGVIVAAVSGALVAKSKGMDIFGIGVIAFVTALGGGTVRDLLLNRHPIFWFTNQIYLLEVFVMTLITPIYSKKKEIPMKALLIADAFGLAFFTIVGTQIAEARHLSWALVIMMGTITGTMGGILRDILCNDIPLILRKDVYATVSIAGAAVYLIIKKFGFFASHASVGGMVTIIIFRMIVIYHGINLPTEETKRH
ncbi:MAG: trimeric intracellular cation channel family protein [Ignavibacteria bacterium]|nr:trimeric intracellular cation channel family protein [Ignavibacteria bacterium]